MSKLIVEMEMPKDCPMCPMAHYNKLDEFTGCEVAAGKLFAATRDKAYVESASRPSWCPIVGVLPDEHGRLIDASTVIGIQQDEEGNDLPVTVDDYLGLQFPVPAIVPATERSEHGTTAD